MRAFYDTGKEYFPNAAADEFAHRINAPVPIVEIADHAHALRVRRPDGEVNSLLIANRPQMRTEFLVKLEMISFGEKMQIHLAHDRSVAIRIVQRPLRSIPAHCANPVIAVTFFPRQHCLEKSVVMNSFRRDLLLRWENDRYFARVRPKDANDKIVSHAMRAEDPERIGMCSFDEGSELVRW